MSPEAYAEAQAIHARIAQIQETIDILKAGDLSTVPQPLLQELLARGASLYEADLAALNEQFAAL